MRSLTMSEQQNSPARQRAAASSATAPRAASGGSDGSDGPGLTLYGGSGTGRRVTVRDLARAKRSGERWPMLTAYDAMIASVFDDAGIPVLLVGDSAGNNH